MCKAQNAANAAHNGVLAATLAKEGFTGPRDIFDSEQNVFSLFAAATNHEELLTDLGRRYELSDNTPKVYACSGWRSPIVQACIAIAETYGVTPAQVVETTLLASSDVLRFSNYPDPTTGAQAKFSTEFAAAVALTDRAGGVEQFNDTRAADPALRELGKKVVLETSDELKPHQMRVTVRTADGRQFEHFVAAQKGDAKNPLSDDELITKFRANASAVLPAASVEELIERILNLEAVKDAAQLVALCRGTS
jgi:2-methylcitrate dehydratase PrpD